jgi:hypothetical protein
MVSFQYKIKQDLIQCKCKTVKQSIGCSLKFPVKVGAEESIVNAPLVSLQIKNTNKAKSEVRFKQLTKSCTPWCVHNRLFNANLTIFDNY